ncbi:Dual specificity phosphatase [Seminavis robusta]|uniref:Dual specificity phosphatase n=1 Tax=Seminavis robusta TaxID=568900 RepID=A0A9N8EKM8_9STRA|nr:Dual specificity phosphatase [Seminavis robusta]|eukprot:Sro1267_g257610.1 Dual specificity phosphatase (99) ;mRNA; r:17-313
MKRQPIRYLTSVNYHGSDGADKVGSSLAPFFDQEPAAPENDNIEEKKSTRQSSYLGILGAAVGMGIEDSDDIDKIQTFFQTLRSRLPQSISRLHPFNL